MTSPLLLRNARESRPEQIDSREGGLSALSYVQSARIVDMITRFVSVTTSCREQRIAVDQILTRNIIGQAVFERGTYADV